MVDMSHIDRAHPDAYSHVLLSLRATVQLNCASQLSPLKLSKWEIAEEAIADWVARHEPGAIPMPSIFGLQWKQLFLPNGTVLRTVFGGRKYHCRVEDDQLRYEGKPMSPNEFANLPGGSRRNAWKVIWILLPETRTWQLAADLRPARPVRAGRSRARESGTAPVASDATMPTAPRAACASAACRHCDLPLVDAGHEQEEQEQNKNQDRRQIAGHQRIVPLDCEPEEDAAQRPSRGTHAQTPVASKSQAAPGAQELTANACVACHDSTQPVQQDQPVSRHQAESKQHDRRGQHDRQAPDSAHQASLEHIEQEQEGDGQSAGRQSHCVQAPGEGIKLDQFDEARTGVIERRRRASCRGCQLSVEALLL